MIDPPGGPTERGFGVGSFGPRHSDTLADLAHEFDFPVLSDHLYEVSVHGAVVLGGRRVTGGGGGAVGLAHLCREAVFERLQPRSVQWLREVVIRNHRSRVLTCKHDKCETVWQTRKKRCADVTRPRDCTFPCNVWSTQREQRTQRFSIQSRTVTRTSRSAKLLSRIFCFGTQIFEHKFAWRFVHVTCASTKQTSQMFPTEARLARSRQ